MQAARSLTARSTARGDATRQRILEAAAEILRETGYAGLSISGVCARAGISPTSLYWHFGSKAGLMRAVVDHTSAHAQEIQSRVLAAGSDPEARLGELIAALRRLVITQPFGSLTGLALLAEGRHATPELAAALQEARGRELQLATSELRTHLGLSEPDGRSLATLMMAATNYAAMTYRCGADEGEVDRILGALRDTILRYAEPREERPRELAPG
ncbi:MAG: TetR/AcrR family transcriptional regulator [Myxococcota bacterium]